MIYLFTFLCFKIVVLDLFKILIEENIRYSKLSELW
jgi:hypothetical protein